MSRETVEISKTALARLYGSSRALVEMDGQAVYSADTSALQEAEDALGRDGPYGEASR